MVKQRINGYVIIISCLVLVPCISAFGDETDEKIKQHRMGELIIKTSPGARVTVQQLRHEFWFGAAISSSQFNGRKSQDSQKYKDVFLENFNAAVTENALKWHSMERRKGQIDYSIVDAMLKWTDENDIPLRGHNIFWGVPGKVSDWQKNMDNTELNETLKNRALTIGERYKVRFSEYDLNNEMIHGNYYEQRLGDDITKKMADWVKQADPDAKLYLNDYDILTGNKLDDYIKHIRKLKTQGVLIDGVGVQGHLHGDSFDPAKLRDALDQLAKEGLPICVTEFNFPGQRSKVSREKDMKLTEAQEQAKAKAIVEYYRICFAHPAVEGILMWGFWERANWIPQSSLYRSDWSPTPAASAYRDLVYHQWWTQWQGESDTSGTCEIRAFYGKHRIMIDGKEHVVELKKSDGTYILDTE